MSPVVATLGGLLLPTAKQPKPMTIKSLLHSCLSPTTKGDEFDGQDQVHDPSEALIAVLSKKHPSHKTATSSKLIEAYSLDPLGWPHSRKCHSDTANAPGCTIVACVINPAAANCKQPTSTYYSGPPQLSSCQQRLAPPAVLSAVAETISTDCGSSSSSDAQPVAAAAAAAAVTSGPQQQASAGLDTLNDEQLLLLSHLPISQNAVRQCSLAQIEQLFTSATKAQQLGRGGHSLVVHATIPWSVSAAAAVDDITSAAEAAGVSVDGLAAAAAGLPVVIKLVKYQRYEGSTLFNMDGRLREERHCKLAGVSPYFPVLYRAIHMKRRSYLIFGSITAYPISLAEYVQQMQRVPAAGLTPPGPGPHSNMQHQHQQTCCSDGKASDSPCSCTTQSREAAEPYAAQPRQQQQQQPQHSLCSMTWHDAVLQILQDVALGLDHLHSLGLLHLDVKPSNIIMREGGHAYLIDLGVACEIGETLAHHGMVGTEAAMDPQIRDDTELLGCYQVHHDYYSLGVVALYLVLKGSCNLFVTVQSELEKALLLEESACKAPGGLTRSCSLHHHSMLGFGWSRSRLAAIAAKHIVRARQLLSNAGVGRGMSDMVTTLVGPTNRRPTSHQQLEVLLEHAKLCDDPEQNDVWEVQDGSNIGFVLPLLALLAAVMCAILWVVC